MSDVAAQARDLTNDEWDALVLEVLTARRRATPSEEIVRVLQCAGAIKPSRIALIFPTHPHRTAVNDACQRLYKAGRLAFMDVDSAGIVSREAICPEIADAHT
jgi:hypothetical protein